MLTLCRKAMWRGTLAAALLSQAAFGADPNGATQDVLLRDDRMVLPWLVGTGILVMVLIAGFKHPGRTHLD